MADLNEELQFVEALLAKPEEHSQLPPSPHQTYLNQPVLAPGSAAKPTDPNGPLRSFIQ